MVNLGSVLHSTSIMLVSDLSACKKVRILCSFLFSQWSFSMQKKKKKVFSVIFYFSLPVYKTKTKPKVLWNEQSSLIKNFPSLHVILNIPVVLNINEVCWNVSEKKIHALLLMKPFKTKWYILGSCNFSKGTMYNFRLVSDNLFTFISLLTPFIIISEAPLCSSS